MLYFLIKSKMVAKLRQSDEKTVNGSGDLVNVQRSNIQNSIRDARTPPPGEIFFNTMRYRSGITVQSSRYIHSSVSYIKVQIMLK